MALLTLLAPSLAQSTNSTGFLAPRNSSAHAATAAVDMEIDQASLEAAGSETCQGFDFSRCTAWMREHLPGGLRRNATAQEIECCKEQFKDIARNLPWWAWPLIVVGVVACGLCLICSVLRLGFELIKAIVCCPWRCCCGGARK